jgi:thiol:disulfide interchange protein
MPELRRVKAGKWDRLERLCQVCGRLNMIVEVSNMKWVKAFVLVVLLAFTGGLARSAGRDIYPAPSQAKADLTAALKTAATTHKRVLVDFGGNWCGDCQVLDIYFHDPNNLKLLERNYVLIHVNVGRLDTNKDLARQLEVPLEKGVPALAVLSENGKLLYSQKNGQFESMGKMQSSAVTAFLVQWRPDRKGCSAVVVNC